MINEDYALPLIVIRRLTNEYEAAMQKKQWALAYKSAEKMVEMALKLQDLADGN
jgi:uroporphyrinogen-III decarboxylase